MVAPKSPLAAVFANGILRWWRNPVPASIVGARGLVLCSVIRARAGFAVAGDESLSALSFGPQPNRGGEGENDFWFELKETRLSVSTAEKQPRRSCSRSVSGLV